MNKILVIAGPTATGKTAFSIQLATQLDAEIVNFDSLLFYRELNIGTAKPSTFDRDLVKHHLIDVSSAKDYLNAADFSEIALKAISDIHRKNKIAILVGGSGFYLQALMFGMFQSETTSSKILEKSQSLYDQQGIKPFWDELLKVDPIKARQLHYNDHYRIRRAIEHFWQTKKIFSDSEKLISLSSATYNLKDWNVMWVSIDMNKERHFKIIQKRTHQMIQDGLVDEVEFLIKNLAFSGQERTLQSIGYKETLAHVKGLFNKQELAENINIHTRQLAKSQRTWFKKRLPPAQNVEDVKVEYLNEWAIKN